MRKRALATFSGVSGIGSGHSFAGRPGPRFGCSSLCGRSVSLATPEYRPIYAASPVSLLYVSRRPIIPMNKSFICSSVSSSRTF